MSDAMMNENGSVLEPNAASTQPAPEPVQTAESQQTPPPSKAIGFKIMSVALLLLGLGGLFIGLLGNIGFLSFMKPVGDAWYSSDPAKWYDNSFLGQIIEIVMGFMKKGNYTFPGFSMAGGIYGLLPTLMYLQKFVIVAVVLLSAVLALISLIFKKVSKPFARIAGYLLFLGFGGYFFMAFLGQTANVESGFVFRDILTLIDLPSLIITALVVLLLMVDAIACGVKNKNANVILTLIITVLSVAAFIGFFWPLTADAANTAKLFGNALTGGKFALLNIFALAVGVVVLVNVLLSLVRLPGKRFFWFDALRLGLQFLLTVVLAILLALKPASGAANWGNLLNLSVILFVAASLAAFLFALVAWVISVVKYFRKNKKPAKEEQKLLPPAEEPAPEPEPAPEEEGFPADQSVVALSQELDRGMNPYGAGYDMHNSNFLYDPFFVTLTPDEKNEFGDLFIAQKKVKLPLPKYSIGGDNDDFFRLIFVYLGLYRSEISADLLEKIYSYVNSIR